MSVLLEDQFHEQMLGLYNRARVETGYRPTRFLQRVRNMGGLAAAKKWLNPSIRTPEGLGRLAKLGRLDLTMEALVNQSPWSDLFTSEELAVARARLDNAERQIFGDGLTLASGTFQPTVGAKKSTQSLGDVIKELLFEASRPMTPQEIRDKIKDLRPEMYGTPSHLANVAKGHYKDLDHALLAQIYSRVRSVSTFYCDTTRKPMRVSLIDHAEHSRQEYRPTRTMSEKGNEYYDEKVRYVLSNIHQFHDAFYRHETFRGPSLYFHQRALSTRIRPASLTHLEYVYATLSAWGMHRMGPGGSKMKLFGALFESTQILEDKIVEAQTFDLKNMNDLNWAVVKEVFCGIRVMESATSLVGNSKVMHHMLPNIIPPIDREYTLTYLRGNTNIKNDLETEWLMMHEIISQFFVPIASNPAFRSAAFQWMNSPDRFPWDTSLMKIIDNLIIGLIKG